MHRRCTLLPSAMRMTTHAHTSQVRITVIISVADVIYLC
jgi:hypothetical protein